MSKKEQINLNKRKGDQTTGGESGLDIYELGMSAINDLVITNNFKYNRTSFYECTSSKVVSIDDYKPVLNGDHIRIDAPRLFAVPIDFRYKMVLRSAKNSEFLTRYLESVSGDEVNRFNEVVASRMDIIASIFRKLFLAGNGHFKVKAMQVDHNMIDAVVDYVIDNASAKNIDIDLKPYCYDEKINFKNGEIKLLKLFMFHMISSNGLISNKMDIMDVLDQKDSSVDMNIKLHIKRSKLQNIIDNIQWVNLTRGDCNIVTAANAFADSIRSFNQNFKYISAYESAYEDVLSLVKLVILQRTDLLGLDYEGVLQYPQFKTLCTVSNIIMDALSMTVSSPKPSYTLQTAVNIVYEGLFNNKEIEMKSAIELKNYFSIQHIKGPIRNKLKYVIVNCNINMSYDHKILTSYRNGRYVAFEKFDVLDSLIQASKHVVDFADTKYVGLLSDSLRRGVNDDAPKKLIYVNMNDTLVNLLAMAHSKELFVKKLLPSDKLESKDIIYVCELTDEQKLNDESLCVFGNVVLFDNCDDALFYSTCEYVGNSLFIDRSSLTLDLRYCYEADRLDEFIKPNVFRRLTLNTRLLHPTKLDTYWNVRQDVSIGEVLLHSGIIKNAVQFVKMPQPDIVMKNFDLSNVVKVVEQCGIANDIVSLFMKRQTARYYERLFKEMLKSDQLKALYHYAYNQSVIKVNEAVTTDANLKEYRNIHGESSKYDIKFKLSCEYAVCLWFIQTLGLISEEQVTNLYDLMQWFIQYEHDATM